MQCCNNQRFRVSFTESVTFTAEIAAGSEEMALEQGCEMLHRGHTKHFMRTEPDYSDLTAVPLHPTALNMPQRTPAAAMGTYSSTSRPITSGDVAVLIKLLEEVRDTTLSHGAWDDAKRMIRQLTE